MTDYRLTGVAPEVWQRAKERATYEGRTLKFVLVEFLKVYAEHGFTVVETFDGKRRPKD